VIPEMNFLFDPDLPCRTIDPDVFYPENAEDSRKSLRIIRPLCASCDHRIDCVQMAMVMETGKDQSHRFGIWGATLPKERLAMARLGLKGLPEIY
jgi:hypothetical protein